MRISDWSSDVCSSDLGDNRRRLLRTRYADVEAFLVDQIGGAAVGMNDDVIGRPALRGERRVHIAMGYVTSAGGIQPQRLHLPSRCTHGGGSAPGIARRPPHPSATSPPGLARGALDPDAANPDD